MSGRATDGLLGVGQQVAHLLGQILRKFGMDQEAGRIGLPGGARGELRLPRLKAGDSDQLLLRSFRLRSANASQVGAVSSGPSTGRVRPKPAPVAPTL